MNINSNLHLSNLNPAISSQENKVEQQETKATVKTGKAPPNMKSVKAEGSTSRSDLAVERGNKLLANIKNSGTRIVGAPAMLVIGSMKLLGGLALIAAGSSGNLTLNELSKTAIRESVLNMQSGVFMCLAGVAAPIYHTSALIEEMVSGKKINAESGMTGRLSHQIGNLGAKIVQNIEKTLPKPIGNHSFKLNTFDEPIRKMSGRESLTRFFSKNAGIMKANEKYERK